MFDKVLQPIGSIAPALISEIITWGARDKEQDICTGIPQVDNNLWRGLLRGELTVVAGRPNAGKSAFALRVALFNALTENIKVCCFYPRADLPRTLCRILCGAAGMDAFSVHKNVWEGTLSSQQIKTLASCAQKMTDVPLHLCTEKVDSLLALEAVCLQENAKGQIDLIIIDTLQDLCGGIYSAPAPADYSCVALELKRIAARLRVPVLLLSDLTYIPDSRKNHEPEIADLSAFGNLAETADSILLLYRPYIYGESETAETKVSIAKGYGKYLDWCFFFDFDHKTLQIDGNYYSNDPRLLL